MSRKLYATLPDVPPMCCTSKEQPTSALHTYTTTTTKKVSLMPKPIDKYDSADLRLLSSLACSSLWGNFSIPIPLSILTTHLTPRLRQLSVTATETENWMQVISPNFLLHLLPQLPYLAGANRNFEAGCLKSRNGEEASSPHVTRL